MQKHTHAFLFFLGGLFLMLVGPSLIPSTSAAVMAETAKITDGQYMAFIPDSTNGYTLSFEKRFVNGVSASLTLNTVRGNTYTYALSQFGKLTDSYKIGFGKSAFTATNGNRYEISIFDANKNLLGKDTLVIYVGVGQRTSYDTAKAKAIAQKEQTEASAARLVAGNVPEELITAEDRNNAKAGTSIILRPTYIYSSYPYNLRLSYQRTNTAKVSLLDDSLKVKRDISLTLNKGVADFSLTARDFVNNRAIGRITFDGKTVFVVFYDDLTAFNTAVKNDGVLTKDQLKKDDKAAYLTIDLDAIQVENSIVKAAPSGLKCTPSQCSSSSDCGSKQSCDGGCCVTYLDSAASLRSTSAGEPVGGGNQLDLSLIALQDQAGQPTSLGAQTTNNSHGVAGNPRELGFDFLTTTDALKGLAQPAAAAPVIDFITYFKDLFTRLFDAFEYNLESTLAGVRLINEQNVYLNAKMNLISDTYRAKLTTTEKTRLDGQMKILDADFQKAVDTHGSATATITAETLGGKTIKVVDNDYGNHGNVMATHCYSLFDHPATCCTPNVGAYWVTNSQGAQIHVCDTPSGVTMHFTD